MKAVDAYIRNLRLAVGLASFIIITSFGVCLIPSLITLIGFKGEVFGRGLSIIILSIVFFLWLVLLISLLMKQTRLKSLLSLIRKRDRELSEEVLVTISISSYPNPNYSEDLIERHKRRIANALYSNPIFKYLDLKRYLVLFSLFIIISLCWTGFLSSKPYVFSNCIKVLFPYRVNELKPKILSFDAPVRLPRGEMGLIRAGIDNPNPVKNLEVLVEIDEAGRAKRSIPLTLVSKGNYQIKIGPLFERTNVQIIVDKVRSPIKTIYLYDPPRFSNIDMELTFPAYSNLPPQYMKIGSVKVLRGTRINLKGNLSTPVKYISLQYNERHESISLKGDLRTFNHEFTALQSGYFELNAADSLDNLANTSRFTISIIPDSRPVVTITEPAKDITMPPYKRFSISAKASDDFKVTRIALRYTYLGKDYDISLAERQDQSSVSLDYSWDLSKLPLREGTEIKYRVIAYDNDNISGPKIGESNTYVVSIPSNLERIDEIKKEAKKSDRTLDGLKNEARRLSEEAKQLANEAAASKKISPDLDKRIKQHAASWEDLKKRLQELAKEYKSQREQMQGSDAVKQELLDKEAEIEKLLRSLESSDFLKDLKKDNINKNPNDLSNKLEDISKKGDKYNEELDKLAELLKKARIEEALQRMEHYSRKMKEEEEQARSSADPSSRDKIRSDQKDVWKRLKAELKETKDASKDNALKDDLKATEEWNDKNLENKMNESEFNKSSSEGRQKNLASLEERFREMQKNNAARQKAMMQETIKRMQVQATFLSRELGNAERQQDNKKRTQSLESTKQGLDILDKDLGEIERMSFLVPPSARQVLEMAMERVEKAKEDSRINYTTAGREGALQAMGNVNILHQLLDQLSKDITSGSTGTGFMEAMKQIAQMQGDLNKDTKNMGQGMPGGNGGGSLSGRQMALARMLANAMKKQGSKEGQGELNGMQKDMKDIADKLGQNKINDDLLKKQDRLYIQLLNYSNAMRNQGEEEKREAEQPVKIYSPPQEPSREKEKRELEQKLLLRLLRGDYPANYRTLLEQYFRKMEERK